MGFSRMIGIGSSLMQNLLLVRLPLTMEILRDLMGLISIHALLMFSWRFSNRHLVNAFVVIVVMSSMYTMIEGRHSPFLKCSPPTTFHDAQRMSTIAMVNARGEMVQPNIMPISRCCDGVVLCCDAELEILEVSFD